MAVKVWNGSEWVEVSENSGLLPAPNPVNDERILTYFDATEKWEPGIKILSQDAEPTTNLQDGDIWIDTDDMALIYIRESGAWVPINIVPGDNTVSTIKIQDGAVTTNKLDTSLTNWSSYTPVNTNIVVGNGVLVGRKLQIGNTMFFYWSLEFGSTTSFSGNVSIGLPAAAQSATAARQVCSGWSRDLGTRSWVLVVNIDPSGTTATLQHTESGNGGVVNGSNPYTPGTGDIFAVSGSYELA